MSAIFYSSSFYSLEYASGLTFESPDLKVLVTHVSRVCTFICSIYSLYDLESIEYVILKNL